MSRPGKTWNHLPKHASLEEIGWNIQDIKKWREREHNNGKASRLDDFFSSHGLCSACRCVGARMIGRDDETGDPLWEICPVCGGTGKPIFDQ